ncbi:GNAT family N-acetyltransferase [Thalassomonas viridans]|uniref:GNAT family N-acetyltransferase n=1 Tax=Thalassomonas viridans TaxID=137584 RepID=A0AAF0CAJ1_9GAMM|nr:GNAT family N-acetyltransferase [Thalassomonas viridans]WDE08607.1 GNAT family N-acetyltransferase [Thalassomonas viridans]
MADTTFSIHTMNIKELELAIDWAKREGWNPGRRDAALFYQADPGGFFAGKINGQTIAVGSAVAYDETFAFCGLYIVAPEYRGKGYGLALTEHRLAYCGGRNVGIDGVLENVNIYRRIGYVPYYENRRYQFTAAKKVFNAAAIKAANNDNFAQLLAYDRQCFPAPRKTFLKKWLEQTEGRSLVYSVNGVLQGYIVRRRCAEGYKIGPLFADNAEVAQQLLNAVQTDIEGETVLLDVPEINRDAVTLAQRSGMKVIFATARMYQKGLPDIANEKIFGITTFELG